MNKRAKSPILWYKLSYHTMPAPEGNTFALGNNGGRPPRYESADELASAIEEYFSKDLPKTITGLALYLGFSSRQSLYDYEQKEEFSYVIKRARLTVENYYELQLTTGGSATGPIFALKQMGWSDRKELDLKSSDGSMSPPSTLAELYDQETKEE